MKVAKQARNTLCCIKHIIFFIQENDNFENLIEVSRRQIARAPRDLPGFAARARKT